MSVANLLLCILLLSPPPKHTTARHDRGWKKKGRQREVVVQFRFIVVLFFVVLAVFCNVCMYKKNGLDVLLLSSTRMVLIHVPTSPRVLYLGSRNVVYFLRLFDSGRPPPGT